MSKIIKGTTDRPRLTVFKSNKMLYAQIVDDTKGVTLASAMGKDPKEVGVKIAEKTLKKKIKKIVFDKNRYKYHGNVKLIADNAREGGLEF